MPSLSGRLYKGKRGGCTREKTPAPKGSGRQTSFPMYTLLESEDVLSYPVETVVRFTKCAA